MGLFGSSGDDDVDTDPRASRLAANARSDTVTSDLLRSESALTLTVLESQSVPDILREDEQPHYLLTNASRGVSRDGVAVSSGLSDQHTNACLVTDQRVIFLTKGTLGEAVPFGVIEDAHATTGRLKHRLDITTADHEYSLSIDRSISGGEVVAAAAYICEQAANAEGDATEGQSVAPLGRIWDEAGAATSAGRAIADEPRGPYVTPDRVEKVVDVLEPDERVHYLTRGSTVDTEGAGSGHSLFGDDRSRKSGTTGYVRAAITDRRVAVKIPQLTGNDQRSVLYDNITSVDVDTGLVNNRLTLHTAGPTYHIEVHEPGKEELNEAAGFIRKQVSAAKQPDTRPVGGSEPSTADRLRELKELNEEGLLSDEEFESKRTELVDEL